jgi:diguanylate cyclase (GGDEF)-like protein/PAS domain S-box-containing protein
VSQIIDVTREIEATDELERTAERYRVLAENASDIVYEVDRDGRLLWVSPSLTAVLGWAPEQWLGRPVAELVDPAIVEDLVPEIVAFFAGQGIEPRVARFPAADGSMREMSVTVHAGSLDEQGLPLNAVVGLHDVTEEQRARRELARSEERFRLAMDAAPIGMAISDPQGAFVQVNDALCDLLGLTPDELMGRSVSDFLLPEEQHVADEATQALSVRHDESMRHEHRLASPSRTVWVEHAASLLRGDDGEPLFYVHQFVDRTEARELRADLEYRATHDALTGVINRAELMSQLDHSLRRLRGTASWLGVLFIDLDNLKTINDENGHHAGDVAIQAVAQRLSDSVRAGDLVARLGGDEFVVLLEHLRSRDELEAVAEKLRAAVTGPIEVDGRVLEVGVSVGAVLAAHDEAPDDALARADHGLRRAKEGGRGQVDVD